MDAQAPAFDDFIDTANVADMSDDHHQQSQQSQPQPPQQPQHLQPQHQHTGPQLGAGPRGPADNRINAQRGPPLMPLSISALPPHMGGGMPSPFSGRPMGSPAGQEHFELPPGMTTPRAATSTLHNINFDFYEGASPSPMLTSMSPMPDALHAPAGVMVPQPPMQPGMAWPPGLAVAPSTGFFPGPFAPGIAPMPSLDAAFQHRPIKMEPEAMSLEQSTGESSPSAEERNTSPVSTAPTSLELGSPPSEKKRRLTSPTASGAASSAAATAAASGKGSPSAASTTKKGTKRKPPANKTNGDDEDDEVDSAPSKPAAPKRNPPSASQITESGQPFPVIDTSAKHSSLFVPPDTSGLTKREARLVKNRAAAFLSRQRKREQFEELETKCRSMCRLIWRMWEIIAGPDASWEAFESTVLAVILREETPDVAEVLQQIVGVKGASIAPTEDGAPPTAAPSTRTTTPAPAASSAAPQQQPQQRSSASDGPHQGSDGAFPGPGRERSDSNITAVSAPGIAPLPPVNAAAAAAQAAEIAHLRNQLFAAQQREAALQMELANERARRNGPEAHDLLEQRRPFRPGAPASQDLGLSLTMPPHARPHTSHGGDHHGRTPSLDAPLALPGAFHHDDDLSPTVGRGSASWDSSPSVDGGSFPSSKADASSFGPAYAFAHDVHNDINGGQRGQQHHPQQAVAQAAGSMGPKRAAGGMALMAMIFTFAFFGMPSAPAGPGGITRAPGTEALSLGRVLGPVTSSDLRFAARKPRSVRDGSPSSHLSAQDLSIADLLGDTHIKDPSEADDAEDDYSQLMDSTEDFMDAEAGGDDDGDNGSAALQRVFGSSMDLGWLSGAAGGQGKHAVDVERGFILIGDPDAKEDADVTIDAAPTTGAKPRRGKKAASAASKATAGKGDAVSGSADGDANAGDNRTPTKLTLFVPAPTDSHRTPSGDAAIDAWLSGQGDKAEASKDGPTRTSRNKSGSVSSSPSSTTPSRSISVSASRTETLENASRAALEVLRNHRVAAAQAAAVARAKAGDDAIGGEGDAKKPSPSQRAGSAPRSDDGHGSVSSVGRDFLQLEFSLSGARVRNGRELIELLTTAASRAAH